MNESVKNATSMGAVRSISISKELQTAINIANKFKPVTSMLDKMSIADPVVYEQSRLIDKVKSTNEVNSLALLCGNA